MERNQPSLLVAVPAVVIGLTGLFYLWKHRRKRVLLGYDICQKYRSKNSFRNRFFLVRHGQSQANVAGIISSDPNVGIKTHTITQRGELQARRAGGKIKSLCQESGVATKDKVVIVCSDFLRTRATAGVIAEELSLDRSVVTPVKYLRERYFGDLDGQSDEKYQEVWNFDHFSAFHQEFNCESVASVLTRAADLVVELDSKYSGKFIVLVAHGDVLQILRTAFDGGFPPAHHRQAESLQTGSVTELNVQPLE